MIRWLECIIAILIKKYFVMKEIEKETAEAAAAAAAEWRLNLTQKYDLDYKLWLCYLTIEMMKRCFLF